MDRDHSSQPEVEYNVDEMSDLDVDTENEPSDWYRESDTSDDLPDPNISKQALYQDENKLPVLLKQSHFEEGLVYTMTLKSKSCEPMLVMVILNGRKTFLYRTFFVKGSKKKTYHVGAKDEKGSYEEVWRLAPRRELIQKIEPGNVRMGDVVRFRYGVNDEYITALVMKRTARTIKAKVECGKARGKCQTYDQYEMVSCTEIFGSSVLQELYKQAKKASWNNADESKTANFPTYRPKLSADFRVPPEEPYKRKWHVMKILGEGAELLCKRTNERANRVLSRSTSEAHKSRWKDLKNGPRLWTFLGVKLGLAILRVGPRHLMKQEPSWISQQGKGRLFEKLPGDLYRLWSSHFVAHSHRDTVLFKRSIKEQRIRFYGNHRLNETVYGNSRKARDPPEFISGDETITRLYTQRATDIRMRTSKKNESGILNQNICGSNEGYST